MRSCGACTACCTLCHVPELGKVEGVPCVNLGDKCRVYDDRPPSCSSYRCAWLGGELSDEMRPDRCGVMVEIYPQMVAALLVPGRSLQTLSGHTLAELDKFVEVGKPVISTGQAARLPAGMTGQEAKDILVRTVGAYRNGG